MGYDRTGYPLPGVCHSGNRVNPYHMVCDVSPSDVHHHAIVRNQMVGDGLIDEVGLTEQEFWEVDLI